MRFCDIVGNDQLKASLVQMVETGRLSHAILFNEAGEYGAFAFALALAQYVNCKNPSSDDSCDECSSCHKYEKLIHPDLHFVFPVGKSDSLNESENKKPVSDYFLQSFISLAIKKPYFSEEELYNAIGIDKGNSNISVNESRRIIEKLSLVAFEGKYKTIIIYLPEKMNREASNALLKLLEEPPLGTLFLLITHAPEKLLATIRSRCLMVTLMPLTREQRVAASIDSSDHSEYLRSICSVINSGLNGTLADIFPEWEAMASLPREKQKDFLGYCETFIRKIQMYSLGLEQLADADTDELQYIRRFAGMLKPHFYEKSFTCFENALPLIDANVNSKLIFCDLCNRLYCYLCRK